MTINLGMLLDDALGNHLMQGPVSMIHKKVQMIWISPWVGITRINKSHPWQLPYFKLATCTIQLLCVAL